MNYFNNKTITEMTDEEVVEMNKKLYKRLAIKTAIVVGAGVAYYVVAKQLDKKDEDKD